MDPQRLTDQLKRAARTLGFDTAGVCPAVAPTGLGRFHQWLEAGYAGQMHYLARRAEAYQHPRHVMDGVRSLLMLTMNYRNDEPCLPLPGQGRVSCYAWGASDYHDIIRERLDKLIQRFGQLAPGAAVRGVVDTAPLMERELAQAAGLGWIGKNTLLLSKQAGSWFFLAALLTDVELVYDPAHDTDHCGTCRACLDACPTDAFPQPYVLDATRCISYLTIELRDSIPHALRSDMGDWVFGCDICQDVCPWNHRAPRSTEPALEPQRWMRPLELAGLFYLNEQQFRQRFRHTPLWRSKRRGLLRNAAVVLGNFPAEVALEALLRGLTDGESLVRGACAWALGQYGDPRAWGALRARLQEESDVTVREEIALALGE